MGNIGIITFHRTTNFGSLLQTYGLYKKITDLGYDCEIVDYRCPAIERAEKRSVRINLKNPIEFIKEMLFQPVLDKKAKRLDFFIKNEMRLSKAYTPATIHKANTEYNQFIVGSDIVWGRDITNDDYNYFLDFVTDNRKKYAFSSSVGDCVIRDDEERLKGLLSDFSMLAVREKDAVDWVKRISGKTAEWVCDPTMLLTAAEWKKSIDIRMVSDNYVLVYFDDPKHNCLTSAIAYAKKHKLKVYYIKYGLPIKGVHCKQPTSVEEFLSLIYSARMIFTASYHGMLFSIYFHKEFMFYTRAHNSRVLSLAERLRLENRCGNNNHADEYESIDYHDVDIRLSAFRDQSIKILQEMLKDGNKEGVSE